MPSNPQRIQQLRGVSKLLIVIGLPVFIYLLFFHTSSHLPLEDQEAIRVETQDLLPGEFKIVPWKGRELIVIHRDGLAIALLKQSSQPLYDENSRMSRQPDYAKNQWRFRDPNWLVVINQSPDTGCKLEITAEGFVDPCRGSLYDWSGRVLVGQPSKRNLEVPGHRFENGNIYVF